MGVDCGCEVRLALPPLRGRSYRAEPERGPVSPGETLIEGRRKAIASQKAPARAKRIRIAVRRPAEGAPASESRIAAALGVEAYGQRRGCDRGADVGGEPCFLRATDSPVTLLGRCLRIGRPKRTSRRVEQRRLVAEHVRGRARAQRQIRSRRDVEREGFTEVADPAVRAAPVEIGEWRNAIPTRSGVGTARRRPAAVERATTDPPLKERCASVRDAALCRERRELQMGDAGERHAEPERRGSPVGGVGVHRTSATSKA